MKQTYIIAEAGVNHNGDENRALEMIDCAKEMGADAIKFQLFRADKLVTLNASQAEYQKKAYSQKTSQHAMLKALELSEQNFIFLKNYAANVGIDFMVTPFDLESLDFIRQQGLPIIKIGSGDITFGPLLLAAARTQKKIILSTGMSTLDEIQEALQVISFGLMHQDGNPTLMPLETTSLTSQAQQILREKVILLHCVSEYPAPFAEINLRAMDTLAQAFGLMVGFSDHTLGIEVALAAVARGAKVIEKHFTLDKLLPGPDHPASLDIKEFAAMVKGIRHIESALGESEKIPTKSELKNKTLVRRSLVAASDINIGDVFSPDNLAMKRPCAGKSPMSYWAFLGKKATRNYAKDELIT
ncbi:MAG: N-acetylneuraminate synthase [Candidatus Berkiellales bacterium]